VRFEHECSWAIL